MVDFKTAGERLITLAWNDVEPKLKAGLASGAVVAVVEGYLTVAGVPVPGVIDGLLVLAASTLAGYIKKTAVKVPVAGAPAPKVPLPTPADVAPETNA